MKKNIMKLILVFVLALSLVISFGCSPKQEEPPLDQLDDLDKDDKEDGLDQAGHGKDDVEMSVIGPSEKQDTSDLTLLDSIKIDFNGDGFEETIGLYTIAERMADGEIAWDDGQNWTLIVEGEDEDYILFEDYVQLGSLSFFTYFQNDDFVVTTIHSGTANLALTEYKYDEAGGGFVKIVRFNADGDINMFHQLPLKY